MNKIAIFFMLILTIQLFGAIEDTFPSPANSLGDDMVFNNGAQINGTTANTIVTKGWVNNGVQCDGGACVMSNTWASPYSFTLDTGSGSSWVNLNSGDTQTYNTSQELAGINLNIGGILNLTNDITIKINGYFSPSGTINIIGNVVIHASGFNQNEGSTINVLSGSLIIIANDITLDSTSSINAASLMCFANNQLILNEGVILRGFLYSNGSMFLNKNSIVYGAVTANRLTMNENSTINYSGSSSATTSSISGTIFDEIIGNPIPNVSVHLYEGNVLQETEITDASGLYTFDVSDGDYSVVVDSKTIGSYPTVWADQIYAPIGGLCSDVNGVTQAPLIAEGVCYGGKRGNLDDDASSLNTAEHIVEVEVSGSDVGDLNFGFSFNGVTNIKDTGQGTLRQFISNANAISGLNIMMFVPAVPKNSANWWTITLSSALPDIVDDLTIIDGRAYNFDGSIRDENSGIFGNGGQSVGTGNDSLEATGDEAILPNYEKLELEINVNDQGTLFNIRSNNSMVTNIAAYNNSDGGNGDRGITIIGNDNGVSNCFIGSRADGSDAGAGNRFGVGIATEPTSLNSIIEGNYIAYLDVHGVWMQGTGVVRHNDILQTGLNNIAADGISMEFTPHSDILIEENMISNIQAFGIESYDSVGGFLIRNNTIFNVGLGSYEKGGIRLFGDNSTVINNVIKDSHGAGIVVAKLVAIPTTNNLISKNAIYNNQTLSIDLDHTHTSGAINGDGITPNNASKDSTKANIDMDYPIFTLATLSGTTLHIEGYIGTLPSQSTFANASVEIYKVDDDGDNNGEGRWYLGTCMSDSDGNINCDITTSLVVNGDKITATASDVNNNTSEFGENFIISSSQPIGCTTDAWLIKDTKSIFEVDIVNKTEDEFASALLKYTNAIGYNELDGYIWGYSNEDRNRTLIRIGKDASGNYESKTFGPILGVGGNPDLPIDGSDEAYINVGDVNHEGHLHLLYRKNDHLGLTAEEDLVYVVDLNSSSSNYLKVINHYEVRDFNRGDPTIGKGLEIVDWAFHPLNKKLYAVSAYGRFYEIDPTDGNVSASDSGYIMGLDDSSPYEVFFDDNGYMYAYGAGAGKVFRIDLSDPDNPDTQAILFSTFGSGAGGDSARCVHAPMGDKPIIVIDDVTSLEGNSGTKDFVFTISLDRPAPIDSGFWYTVTDGSDGNESEYPGAYLSNNDMVGDAKYVDLPVGSTQYSITVKVNSDTQIESDERFFLDLYAPDNVILLDDRAEGIIQNDDYNMTLNAFDGTSNVVREGNITTKIVNKDFNLTLSVYNETTNSAVEDMNITKLEFLNSAGNFISLWNGLAQTDTNGMLTLTNLNISESVKISKIKIYGDYNSTHHDGYSTDQFAVRPDHYKVTTAIIAPDTLYRAGKDFKVGIEAIDYLGNIVTNYNENASVYTLDYNESNSSYVVGNLSFTQTSFSSGVTLFNANYSEVGKLDLNVSEVLANEFASVDHGDGTTLTQRSIGKFNYNMARIYPKKLAIVWDFQAADSSTYTYYSSQSMAMGSFLDLNVTVQNDGGATVENFYGLYAEDVDISIDHSVLTGDLSLLTSLFLDVSTNTNLTNVMDVPNKIQYKVDKELFVQGVGGKNLKVNFDRNASSAQQPLKWRLLNLNASTASNALGDDNTPHDITYLYVRAHAPNQSILGDNFDAKIYYEVYCKQCSKSAFGIENLNESYDDIYWYILDSYASSCTFNGERGLYSSSLVQSSNSINTISVKASQVPYQDKIVYTPQPWLVYNRFDVGVTEQSFKVEFTARGSEWAGKGDVGLTVDKNISNGRYQKIDW